MEVTVFYEGSRSRGPSRVPVMLQYAIVTLGVLNGRRRVSQGIPEDTWGLVGYTCGVREDPMRVLVGPMDAIGGLRGVT